MIPQLLLQLLGGGICSTLYILALKTICCCGMGFYGTGRVLELLNILISSQIMVVVDFILVEMRYAFKLPDNLVS